MTAPRADLDELGRLLAEAHDEVVRLCTPGETWRMSIPANPGRDSDLLLSDALTRAPALLAEVAELRETVARVREFAGYCAEDPSEGRLWISNRLTAALDGAQ